MKCEFCNHPLEFSHHENSKEDMVYQCINCPMLILTAFRNSVKFKLTFVLHKDDKMYTWTNNYDDLTSCIQSFELEKIIGNFGVMGRRLPHVVILKLPQIVNLSADNIISKFNLYMAIS